MAQKEPIVTNKVAPSQAPLSHAMSVEGSRWLFCSGQLGIDPETGALVEGTEAQTAQALENMKALLEAGGATLADVVKATVFLADMADFPLVNEVYRRYFSDPFPTRSAIQVARMARDARVEIECVAILD